MQREPKAAASASPPIQVPGWAFPAVTAAAILTGVAAVVRGTAAIKTAADSDLTNFFFPAAQNILRGQPLHIYAVNVGGYPNYNPPLSIFLIAPLLQLAEAVGFARSYGEQITFVTLPFILLVPLLGYLVMRALRRLHPAIPDIQLLLAYALVVLSPLTWQSLATWYHVEQPLMLCFLFGAVLLLQQRKEELAGALAGLAMLSRTTALMPLLALGVLLLLAREWRSLLKFGGVAGALVLVVMVPFFAADPAGAKYSLLTWRSGAPIGGNTIWTIFRYAGSSRLPHLVDAVARRLDMYAVVLFIVIVTYLAWRRWRISAFGAEAWALLAVAALAVPMLSKTNWPYYYLEPFVFLLTWEFATMHDRVPGVWRWPVLAFCFLAVAATFSQYVGLKSVGYGDRVLVGITSSGAMFAFVLGVWARLGARKSALAPTAPVRARRPPAQAPAPGMTPIAPTAGSTSRVPTPGATSFAVPPAAGSPYGVPPSSPSPSPPPGTSVSGQPLWPPASSPPARAPEGPPARLWPPESASPSRPLPPSPAEPPGRQPGAWPDRTPPGSRWTPGQ